MIRSSIPAFFTSSNVFSSISGYQKIPVFSSILISMGPGFTRFSTSSSVGIRASEYWANPLDTGIRFSSSRVKSFIMPSWPLTRFRDSS